MDSSSNGFPTKEPGLSAPRPSHSDTTIGGEHTFRTSLDKHKKKVQQLGASRCENAQTLYFVCKHGHVTRRELRCNSRFVKECPYCGDLWRKKTVERYKKIVSKMQNPKHVVLTLRKRGKHRLEELSKLVQRCRFYLRRQGYKIRSFVFCIEPPNHIHTIWDCDYILQNGLVNIWRTVTGDSFVVYIRRVDKQRWRKAVYYITKYITKISDTSIGMKGLHVIGSWGGEKSPTVRMVCKECGSYFSPLWDLDYSVVDYVAVEFKEVDYG